MRGLGGGETKKEGLSSRTISSLLKRYLKNDYQDGKFYIYFFSVYLRTTLHYTPLPSFSLSSLTKKLCLGCVCWRSGTGRPDTLEPLSLHLPPFSPLTDCEKPFNIPPRFLFFIFWFFFLKKKRQNKRWVEAKSGGNGGDGSLFT